MEPHTSRAQRDGPAAPLPAGGKRKERSPNGSERIRPDPDGSGRIRTDLNGQPASGRKAHGQGARLRGFQEHLTSWPTSVDLKKATVVSCPGRLWTNGVHGVAGPQPVARNPTLRSRLLLTVFSRATAASCDFFFFF